MEQASTCQFAVLGDANHVADVLDISLAEVGDDVGSNRIKLAPKRL
jgi:hypothetical protein